MITVIVLVLVLFAVGFLAGGLIVVWTTSRLNASEFSAESKHARVRVTISNSGQKTSYDISGTPEQVIQGADNLLQRKLHPYSGTTTPISPLPPGKSKPIDPPADSV